MLKNLFSKFNDLPEPLKRILIAAGLILTSPIILLVLVITILFGSSSSERFLIIELSNWTDKNKKSELENIKIEGHEDFTYHLEADWDNKELTITIECKEKELIIKEFYEIKDKFLSALEKRGYTIASCEEEFY